MPENNLPEAIRLVKDEDGAIRVSSLVVAEKFNKRHADVLRAIDNLLEDATSERRNFAFLSRVAPRGQKLREVEMTELGFSLLAMGFTGKEAIKWKIAFRDAFEMMRQELTRRAPAVNLNDAATLRGLLLNYSEKVLELEGEVGELKPDAEAMKMLRAAEDAITMTAMSKILKVKRPWLFDTMTEAGWFYVQNGTHLPYAPLLNRGYLVMGIAKKDPILRSDGRVQIVASTLVTPKGVETITKIVRHKLDNREMTIKLAKAIMKVKAEDDAREAEEDRAILDKLNHDDRIYGSGD